MSGDCLTAFLNWKQIMPKIFSASKNTKKDICSFVEQNNPAEVIIAFFSDQFFSIQKLIGLLRAMLSLSGKKYSIILKGFPTGYTLSSYVLVEIASLLTEKMIIESIITIKISEQQISQEFSSKVFELQTGNQDEQKIPDDYNHQSDQFEFTNGEIAKKILTAYEDELVIIKAGAKCREAIAKINELYDELMCNDGYDMITLERCTENKRNELRDDIASFWFDYSRTKTDTGLNKLCKEAEKYFSSLEAEVDSTRKQQANQVLPKAFLKVTKDAQMVKSVARDFIKAVFFTTCPNENEKKQRVRTKPYNEILVPTYEAQLLLAEYYQRKYGIQIVILRDWKQNLASYIKKLIQSPSIKVGFIIWTGMLSEEHVVPLIFENVSDKNYLIDLDCLSYGKKDPWNSNEKYFNVEKLAMYLVKNQLGDKIELFSNGTALDITDATRQVDRHSCFTDAITVLREALMDKDGIQVKLRIDPEQTHNLLVNRLHNYNFFKLPGAWSISVQFKPAYVT